MKLDSSTNSISELRDMLTRKVIISPTVQVSKLNPRKPSFVAVPMPMPMERNS